MKRSLSPTPPDSLIAYEIEPGKVIFVHALPKQVALGLTTAEEAVLALLLDGHDNATIAEARGTAARTIANQIAGIYRKLGVSSRAELAAKLSSK